METFGYFLVQHMVKLVTMNHSIKEEKEPTLNLNLLGSGCSSVVREVSSNTRGLQFESNHRRNLITNMLAVEKTKINPKLAGMAHFK